MEKLTREQVLAQIEALKARCDEPINIRINGGKAKNQLEVLAYNHAREGALRELQVIHKEEFDAIWNAKQATALKEKTDLLIASAKRGNAKHQAILAEAGVNIG